MSEVFCMRKKNYSLTGNHQTRYASSIRHLGRKEGNVLFNDTLNTFYFMVIWRQTW